MTPDARCACLDLDHGASCCTAVPAPLCLRPHRCTHMTGKELAHVLYHGLRSRREYCDAFDIDPTNADWDAGINGRLWLHYQFGADDCSFMDMQGRTWVVPSTIRWKCSPRHFSNACHRRSLPELPPSSASLSCLPSLSAPIGSPEWLPIKSFTEGHQDIFKAAYSDPGRKHILGSAAQRLLESSEKEARRNELISGQT